MRLAWVMLFSFLSGSLSFAEDMMPIPMSPPISQPPSEEMLRIRDPFKKPEDVSESGILKTPLEKFSIGEFKLVAVLTGPKKLRAMLVTPDRQSFFVSERMKIGQHQGIIKRITPEKLIVQEVTVNVLGQKEFIETEIRLHGDKEKEESVLGRLVDLSAKTSSAEVIPAAKEAPALTSPAPATSPVPVPLPYTQAPPLPLSQQQGNQSPSVPKMPSIPMNATPGTSLNSGSAKK